MEYLQSLSLAREPFSNSPDPDLVTSSRSQQECLQHLEIAVRLKRGLNVVLGAVGTGKTTICRQLLRELAHAGGIDPFLILDPGFDSPQAFVAHLCRTLGAPLPGPDAATHDLMESAKAQLFELGVVQGRIVCLVVDEGQKMSPQCLELLRELLNFETNEYKLLQIVIFAQVEFMDNLLAQPNLADRINYLHTLAPFTFRETRDMVAARLKLSAVDGSPGVRFTAAALAWVYARSGGYPRRIVALCHKALLVAVSRGRKAVGLYDSLKLASTGAPRHKDIKSARRFAWPVAAMLALAAYAAFAPREQGPAALWQAIARALPERRAPAGPGPVSPDAGFAKSSATAPAILGRIVMPPGSSLTLRLEDLYGRKDQSLLAAMAGANPRIEDIGNVAPGTVLSFPALAADPPPPDTVLVSLAEPESLGEGFDYLRRSNSLEYPLRLLAFAEPESKPRFLVVLSRQAHSQAEARRILTALPDDMAARARVVPAFKPGTVFYTALSPMPARPKPAMQHYTQ